MQSQLLLEETLETFAAVGGGIAGTAAVFVVVVTTKKIVDSITETKFWKNISPDNGLNKFGAQHSFNSGIKKIGTIRGSTVTSAWGVLFVVGLVLLAAGLATGNDLVTDIGDRLLKVSTAVLFTARMISMVQKVSALNILSAVGAQLDDIFKVLKGAKFTYAVVVITIVLSIALFIYAAVTENLSGLEHDALLAATIASVIVNVILIVIEVIATVFISNPVTALAVVVILALLLIVDAIVGAITGESIIGKFTEWLADAIYDHDMVFVNLDDEDRLGLDVENIELEDEVAGFTRGNSLNYTVGLVTTLETLKKSELGKPGYRKKATYRYDLQNAQTDQHSGLDLGDMEDEWTDVETELTPFGRWTVQTSATARGGLTLAATGINRTFNMYLTEAFAVPYQGCWEIIGFEVDCDIYEVSDSSHLNLGEDQPFDVLPTTLAEFVGLGWNVDGAISFPPQADADNDGVLSPAQGGADPDDSSKDTDKDGLTDTYEIAYGLDPENADPDGDNLSDLEELRLFTNPFSADSDGDGLNDYVEAVQGWLILYDRDSDGDPLLTRIWSDPNDPDGDQDNLSDLEEFVFGFNPNVPSDPSVIKDIVRFDDFVVDEEGAPILALRFDEPQGSAAFVDSSGEGHTATCDNSTGACPTAGEDGRYGNALQFNGDDFLTVTGESDFDLNEITVAAWIRVDSFSRQFQAIVTKGETAWRLQRFLATDRVMFAALGTSPRGVVGNANVNDGEWHHVVGIYDGAMYYLYVDGQLDDSTPATGSVNNNDQPVFVGDNSQVFNRGFDGAIDDVFVFDRGLTAAQVADLYNGRYNFNDLIVQPGADLQYEATVTNTHAIQGIHGHQVADSFYHDPEIGTPEVVLNFERSDYVVTFENGTGEASTATCLGDGTCPATGKAGQYARAVEFDGVDDQITLPSLGESYRKYTLAFWLNVSSLPASGDRAYILDTERTDDGALDVYINDAGNVVFDLEGAVTDVGGPHTTNLSFSGNLNTWKHLTFRYTIQTDDFASSDVFINGSTSHESFFTYPDPDEIVVGPGLIGNSLNGDAPYDGLLDDTVFYNDNALQTFTSGPFSEVKEVFNGRYDFKLSGSGLNSPSLLLSPNPPKDTDGRREGSGRGWVRELQGGWPGVLG